MDLTGKGFAHAPHSYLQHASGLAAPYSFAHTPLTTSMFKTGHSLLSPVYSGTLTTSLSPSSNSHTSFSNGHNISSLHRHVEKNTPDSAAAKSQIYASPAPVFNRHKDSFPYGISGVSMPNYNYHGDVYQFTSNGYPRKSRTCSYCGKVFTRSTTRRYHEKRCPLLRAAVSSYMGDETSGSSNTTSQSAARGAGNSVTHSYKGPGQPLGTSHSGTKRSNEPQEASTSMLNKSPSMDRRSGSDGGILGGYQTSVIVKQEHHQEIKALASMTSNTSKHSLTESADSEVCLKKQKLDSSHIMSPGYRDSVMNLSLSKSPLNSINRNDNMGSGLNENYLLGPYGSRIQEREGAIEDKALPSLPTSDRDRYKVDLTTAESEDELEEEEDDDLRPGSASFSTINGQDYKADQLSEIGSVQGESESITSEKRDGKMYNNHKCGICGKGFESSGKLHLHEQLHTKFKPYSCKFCDQKFAKAAQRVEHEKTHNGSEEVTHICAVCGSSFTRKYSLKLHMRRWHQEGPWLCRHCGKASLTQKDLKTHLYSHNLPRLERESLLYMPDTPHNFGASNAESGSEKMGEHSDRDVGTADDQPANASNVQDMEMCQECGRDFPKGYLRYHLKSHEAQKPYSCPICAKRFGYKNNMKSHIKLHTGIKPFQCKVCGAKFTRGSTLRRHARRHGIIADSVWDLFVKPNYNKTGGSSTSTGASNSRISKLQDTHSTSRNDSSSGVGAGSSVMENVESNYLAKTLPSTPSHSSLYPLYASLAHVPHLGLYPGLTSTSYFTQHLPQQASIYAASSQQIQPPQQLDALNLSLNKGSIIDQSDQSSFSNISAERSRSRSRSLSGSDNRQMLHAPDIPLQQRDAGTSNMAVQVNLCSCSPLPPAQQKQNALMKTKFMGEMGAQKSDDASGSAGSNPPSLTPTSLQQLPSSPSAMAVVPYYGSPPSQRESSSPALSVSSIKDYSLETISSLISTGRMFKCFPCECYFSEYAMYRIHSKLHINDDTRPFVCVVCGEDCHDRVYFALHLSEHLR
ncbi:zinc finger protein 236-like [Dreissena polymorpha]|uniref:C2H2-type domain-containing protein n=1 Tax=Dreissena polymorpha TaxID=45954 RepID=A0A9D3Z8U4_DREPO|nr:zinc finger protein 236-like [Dreissena polymorpha]XP_052250704.1 zinc finger protein 236-like [Dreissena polymorpha]XP_052250705.1 zinc finger protein 236-like [Dreissena polymorpha]KAH3712289.1 hypothetical protein DPMN_071983 [Dreissena polymorpha]